MENYQKGTSDARSEKTEKSSILDQTLTDMENKLRDYRNLNISIDSQVKFLAGDRPETKSESDQHPAYGDSFIGRLNQMIYDFGQINQSLSRKVNELEGFTGIR